jgi:tripartite-type tricarboxylate transporter receptor subunit TctC
MKSAMHRLAACAVLAGLLLPPGPAVAQDYPNRPIRMIVPYGTGGVTDITARIVAPRIADILGQGIVIENRAGGASMPGTESVTKARPDGYTLLLTSTALAANPILFKKIPYDAIKDLAPVSLLATVPTVLVVHPSVAANNAKELIALAKAKPGGMNYGSAGNGSGNHLTTEVFKNAAGIEVQHIPYKGGGAVMADLVGGQVSFVFAVLPTAYPYIKSGKLRALGVSSPQRNVALPEVPTIAEAAIPGFNVTEWLGIFAPAGTPQAVIERINAAANKALQSPDVAEKLRTLGADIVGGAPSQMDNYLKSETARWARLAQDVKFEVAE